MVVTLKDANTEYITCRCTPAMLHRVDEAARILGSTRSRVVAQAVEMGLDEVLLMGKGAENPLLNLALQMAVRLAGSPEEAKRVTNELKRLKRDAKCHLGRTVPGADNES